MTRAAPTTRVVKRSVSIAGHRTSISLEEAFWAELKAVAAERGVSAAQLIAEVDGARREANLSSALRVFVLETLRAKASPLTALDRKAAGAAAAGA